MSTDSSVKRSFPNPARNAIEAMLDIEVGSCAFTARSEAAGDHMFGKIADTGTSIDLAARGRLFDALLTKRLFGLSL